MDRLQRDIPKFLDNSRVISGEAKAWWADFFNRASDIYSPHKEQPKTWLLDELKMLKFGVSHSDSVTTSTQSESPERPEGHVPTNASHDIAEMVTAQLHEIPEEKEIVHCYRLDIKYNAIMPFFRSYISMKSCMGLIILKIVY